MKNTSGHTTGYVPSKHTGYISSRGFISIDKMKICLVRRTGILREPEDKWPKSLTIDGATRRSSMVEEI